MNWMKVRGEKGVMYCLLMEIFHGKKTFSCFKKKRRKKFTSHSMDDDDVDDGDW